MTVPDASIAAAPLPSGECRIVRACLMRLSSLLRAAVRQAFCTPFDAFIQQEERPVMNPITGGAAETGVLCFFRR